MSEQGGLPFMDNEWWRLPLWVACLYAFKIHAGYYRRRGWFVSERVARVALGALVLGGPDALGDPALRVYARNVGATHF